MKMGLHEEVQKLSNKYGVKLMIVVEPKGIGELQLSEQKPDYVDPNTKVWVRDTLSGEKYCVSWKAYEADKENLRLMPAPVEKELTDKEERDSNCGEVYEDGE